MLCLAGAREDTAVSPCTPPTPAGNSQCLFDKQCVELETADGTGRTRVIISTRQREITGGVFLGN